MTGIDWDADPYSDVLERPDDWDPADDDIVDQAETDDTWALDELARVMGGVRLQHPSRRPRNGGGEWDPLRVLPPRTLRRLTGGGYLRPDGFAPDEAHQVIAGAVGETRIPDVDAAVNWYVDICLQVMDARAARRRPPTVHRRAADDTSGVTGAAEGLGPRRTRAEQGPAQVVRHHGESPPSGTPTQAIRRAPRRGAVRILDMPSPPEPSESVRQKLADAGRPVIVAMSRGKDSLSVWTSLLDAGVECIPVHLDGIPHLSFVDQSIRDLEQHFQTHIFRLPHPSFARKLANYVYQAPQNCGVIEAAGISQFTYDDVWAAFRADQGLADDTWVAVGVRAADSPMRRVAMTEYGPWRSRKPTHQEPSGKYEVHAVWDWRIADVKAQLKRHKVELPVDYEMFNRTFDGIDERFLRPIRDRFPDDYARIVEWFPLAPLSIMRVDIERRMIAAGTLPGHPSYKPTNEENT
jgi:hypothetical protein